jgi:AAA family ATP:ADP antiporter
VGGSLGAWLGSVRAGTLVEVQGPARLLGAAFGILLVCAALVPAIRMFAARSRPAAAPRVERPLAREGGFALVRSDRYLRAIALLMLFVNIVNTSGEYLFGRYVVEQSFALFGGTSPDALAARERFVGETYARLFSTVNLTGLLLQMFVVSRLFKWLGVERSLFIHPLVAAAGYLLLLRAPSLQLITVVKVADNSLDYSLGNTTRQALWLPTSRDAKYKAKQVVDSLFVRAGDVLQAGIVLVGERLAFAVPAFAAINVLLVGGWLLVLTRLTRLRVQRMESRAA